MSLAEEIATEAEHLRRLYQKEEETLSEIAERYDCSQETIGRAFDIAGIKKRSRGGGSREPALHEKLAEKDELRRLYLTEYLSCAEIAERWDVSASTVLRALDTAGIQQQPVAKRIVKNENLGELYHGERLSTYAIGERIGVSPETVRRALEIADVSRRRKGNSLDAPTTSPPYDEADLAYLAGLIDGEGSVGVRSCPESWDGQNPDLWIKMGAEDTIRWCQSTFGGCVYEESREPPKTTMWKWEVMKIVDMWLILREVLPYLKFKHEAATRVIQYIETHYADQSSHIRPEE